MLTGIWNSVAGYVIIEIKGKGLERFLNLAVQAGIEIWHVRRTGTAAITARVSVAGFYALHALLRGQNVRVRILEKRGLIMRLSKLRFRKALLYGWVVALALLVAASRRIWFIEVDGCDTVQEADVLAALDEMEVRVGARRTAVHTSELGGALMESDPRIAWAGAKLYGVTLLVSLKEAEAIPELPPAGDETPASIYAAKDGVITGITVYDGKAKVHVGDAVLAGQELITGVLRSDEENTLLTHARGEVTATVLYCFEATAGPTLLKPAETGETRTQTRISLFGWELLSKGFEGYEAWETVREERAGGFLLHNCFLPLTAEQIRLYALAEREAAATQEELEKAALQKAERAATEMIPKGARILSKKSETVLLENGAVRATVFITTEENIGETKEIKEPHGEQD